MLIQFDSNIQCCAQIWSQVTLGFKFLYSPYFEIFLILCIILIQYKLSFTVDDPLPPGMPEYIASGSHYFKNIRYRFLVLRRFDCDLHSIIKRHRVDEKSVLVLAVQILDILEHLHDKGYCHSDIKAENLMISKCTYHKKKSRPIDLSSDTSSDTELHTKSDDDSNDEDLDDDDDNESEYRTPTSWKRKNFVPFSGSNPVSAVSVIFR